ncbi:MAG: AAA family ATPase, partial [Acetobacteraceae bacterium]|nr:AAA family ATPase [Acetobacteraceae bacterium]
MDVAVWLRTLGLEQYAPAFRANQINDRVLPNLTAEDLKELGVTALGPRRILLDAIAAMRGHAAAEGSGPPVAGREHRPATAGAEAERRQLTVLFCDLVGSTALSARVDPEDLRGVIADYYRLATDVIVRHGGYVARYIGDGLLVYFGYPEAREEDAERAVRAGLALIEVVRQVPAPEPLRARVGIATGLVVVGELFGDSAAQEVVGETPNLAARLQALAPPDGVLIAPTTRALTGGLFDYDSLGPQTLKGLPASVTAWRVLGESAGASRFEALRGAVLAPLVGREEELALLLRRWEQAQAGDGKVVLISGEPGIGKSRLIHALQGAITGQPHTELRYFCSPHHQDSALHPVIAQLEHAAGLTREDSSEAKLSKLEAVLAQYNLTAEAVSLVAELLSITTDRREQIEQMDWQPRREKLFTALLARSAALAERQPLLLIYEDVHWIDPSSRELLDRDIEQLQ